jgi:hypothetical protein
MRRTLVALLAVLLLAPFNPLAHAKGKDRVWQTGILVDSSTERGSRIHGNEYGVSSRRDDLTYYKIEAGDMVYVVSRSLLNGRDKALDVTINRPVQFAFKGDDCYLQDEKGKEHRLRIEKKIAK